MTRPVRICVLAPHVIQHFVPQYASVSGLPGIDLHVVFGSRRGLAPTYDKGFGQIVQWEDLELDRFQHTFLDDDGGHQEGRQDASEGSPGTLEEALSGLQPDALVVYGYSSGISRRGSRWARRNRRVLVYVSDSERRQRRNLMREALLYPAKRLILRRPDLFMTVGDANEDHYRHFGVDPSRFIRTGFPIDIRRYSGAAERSVELRAQTRESLGLDERDIAILCVGKLVPHKRQMDLLEATERLNQRGGERYVAMLAGSGPDLATLSARASRESATSKHVLGFVPHTRLPNYYLAADVYVHPASAEPHSLAISEATFLGLPAVISDRCGSWGPTDDVRPGINGETYPCGDVAALAEVVATITQDQPTRHRLGLASSGIAATTQRRAHSDAWFELADRIREIGSM